MSDAQACECSKHIKNLLEINTALVRHIARSLPSYIEQISQLSELTGNAVNTPHSDVGHGDSCVRTQGK